MDISQSYKIGEQIPRVQYVQSEVDTWGIVYAKIKSFTEKYASKQVRWQEGVWECGRVGVSCADCGLVISPGQYKLLTCSQPQCPVFALIVAF